MHNNIATIENATPRLAYKTGRKMGAVGRKRIREIALTEFGVRSIIENYCTDRKSLIYVTHYEHEIPPVIDKRLRLVKKL